jgi:DNA sulfur modification protein DndE
MPELTLKKIPFTAESDNRLRMLKGRTSLDRNYLCRMGFCLSLEEPGIPALPEEKTKGAREIDRYTLLGQHGQVYVALLLVWMKGHEVPASEAGDVDTIFIAHMNRGVEIITARVRSLADMASLLPRNQAAAHTAAEAK